MDKNQLKNIIKEEYHNVKSFMEDKYGFTPELGKVISNPYAKSFVNEIQEPEVISQLRDIVNKKQNKKIKDPKSGKMMRVDLYSASAIVKVYDAVNKSNKEKFSKLSLPKMVNVAFTVMKKENVAKNHDGKAAPYGSGYKKVNELLVIVDKFDKNKQDYGKIYYRDGGNRPGDGDINKANKELAKLSKKHKGLTLVSVGRNSKMYDVNESLNEAKYKHTYKSITDQQKDLKRIFPSGHPRVSVKAYHDMNPQGKMKTSYVEIEGPSSYVDAYKKMAFNGKGTMRDVIKFVEKNESVNEGYGPFIKAKNLTDIIKLSKQKKNATFYVTDDNNSRIGSFYLKNGKFAKATTANPNYDFQKNKTNLKDRSDVIYKYKVDESVNEATFVPVSGTKAGGYLVLNNRKYQLKKDIKDVQIGNNYMVTLPKGTIIYNLPGGVLASHKSLEKYDSSSNRYFKKSDYSGIGIRQFPRTIKDIEKHSKVLESVNEAKYKHTYKSITDQQKDL